MRIDYPGRTIDANTLKSGGAWASDQAVTDALFIYVNLNFEFGHVAKNDSAADPRIPNVTDDARAQEMGGFSYMMVPYGYAQHPPSVIVQAAVDEFVAWKAAQPKPPKKHHG